MSVSEVVTYLKDEHNIEVSSQTVRNWQETGRAGVTLPADPTPKQIEAFLDKVGTTFRRGRPKTIGA